MNAFANFVVRDVSFDFDSQLAFALDYLWPGNFWRAPGTLPQDCTCGLNKSFGMDVKGAV